MHPFLSFCETAYIQAHDMMPLLRDYTNPRDFISRLVRKGDLIRLKNGFFLIAQKIETSPIPFPQIANLLYGPSYISFEWALSYYGFIPEGVYVVTSTSTTKCKSYRTPMGTFDYTYLSHQRYTIGIDQQENGAGRFLIATPEKALADLVSLKCRDITTTKDLLVDLLEARRIDENNLKQLNKRHLLDISESYRSPVVSRLVKAIGLL